jgi:uncharacterized protein YndB with AHSA1/START domain
VIRDGQIEHEVAYPHPPERVWRALTEPAELGAWLMPTDFAPRAGHRFTFDARPDLGIIDGEVLDVDPPRLLRCRWSGVFGQTVVTFTLTPDGTGTRLRITHAGWEGPGLDHLPGFDQVWLDKLTKDLAALLGSAQGAGASQREMR